MDALAGHLFVFGGRRLDRIKILYWNHNGFAICSKRLEEATYAIPLGEGAEERRREMARRGSHHDADGAKRAACALSIWHNEQVSCRLSTGAATT